MSVNIKLYQGAILVFFIFKIILFTSLVTNSPSLFLYGDGMEYESRAVALLETGKFGLIQSDGKFEYDTSRLPGYPFFLSVFPKFENKIQYSLWGGVQLIFFHVWLYFIARWLERRFGGRSAVYFVTALSLALPWIHYVTTIHSDLQFAILTFSGFLFLITAAETGRRSHMTSSGLCMAVAALTRPDLVFFWVWLILLLMIFGFLIIFHCRTRLAEQARSYVVPVAIAGFSVFATIVGWAVRNYAVTGKLTYTSSISGVNRMFSEKLDDPIMATTVNDNLLETVHLIFLNGWETVQNFIPALAQLFFNPGRWYLHLYLKGWGIDIDTIGVSFDNLRVQDMPAIELIYMAFIISVSLIIFAVLIWYIFKWVTGLAPESLVFIFVCVWVTLYFVLQKGIWGALTPSGPRYAMSIYPFVIFLGSLAFSRGHDNKSEGKIGAGCLGNE